MDSTLLLVIFGLRIFLLANPTYHNYSNARKMATAQPGEMTLVSIWILQYSLPRMLAEQYFDCPWVTQSLTYLITMIFTSRVVVDHWTIDLYGEFPKYEILSLVWLETTLIYGLVNSRNFYSGLVIMALINLTKYGLIKIATYRPKDEALHSARFVPGRIYNISDLFPNPRSTNDFSIDQSILKNGGQSSNNNSD